MRISGAWANIWLMNLSSTTPRVSRWITVPKSGHIIMIHTPEYDFLTKFFISRLFLLHFSMLLSVLASKYLTISWRDRRRRVWARRNLRKALGCRKGTPMITSYFLWRVVGGCEKKDNFAFFPSRSVDEN